jgi:23S rRNA-/tRNA-specific pseudouridylate synthase
MQDSKARVQRNIETYTADLEAPLHALVRSYLNLSSTTKSRNLIKGGAVRVDGDVIKMPSQVIAEGAVMTIDTGARTEAGDDSGKMDRDREISVRKGAENFPFDILYEDDDIFCYLKPAGWVSASPNPKVDTSFTRAKDYLLALDSKSGRPGRDVHFVNLVEKDISGIGVVVRDMQLRKRLQEGWKTFLAGTYVIVQGTMEEEDGEFSEPRDAVGSTMRKFPYRTMRKGSGYILLKVQCALEDIRNILPGLRSMGCLVIGLGDNAPDPLGRKGIHSFSMELEDELFDARWEVKTRVPKEFLNLVR